MTLRSKPLRRLREALARLKAKRAPAGPGRPPAEGVTRRRRAAATPPPPPPTLPAGVTQIQVNGVMNQVPETRYIDTASVVSNAARMGINIDTTNAIINYLIQTGELERRGPYHIQRTEVE